MIVYYVNNSIHEIPSFVYIARALGGVVLTNGSESFKILREQYDDLPSEYYPTLAEVRLRMRELRPLAVIQPDYTKHELALDFETAHIQVFHGTSDKTYDLSHHVREYDFMLLPGERARRLKEEAGLLAPGNHAVVGYAKTDRVFRGELPRDLAVRNLGLDPHRPTILYAPTWRDHKQNSSLPKFGAEVMLTAPADYNLVVKLHPNTKHYDRKYYGLAERAAATRANLKLLGYEHDIIPIMAAADLLICDISAVAHEFLCFDRPYVFLDPRRLAIGRDKTWIWQCGPVVKKQGLVWPSVEEALARPEKYAVQRRTALETVFFKPDGHAAERAAEAIKAFLARRTRENNGMED
ncbi:MAG: CDP-glycerol glycerophosphotransferase family protein [Bacteroidota bacterium]